MGKVKNNQGFINYVKVYLISTMTAVLSAVVLLVVAAILLDKLGLNQSQVGYMVYGVYLITGFLAGFTAGKIKREKKFLWGALAGIIWFFVVLVVSLAFSTNGIDTKELFPAMLCMLGGGILGGMIA